jgi:hypothetical protein
MCFEFCYLNCAISEAFSNAHTFSLLPSLLKINEEVNWEILINNILKSISDLNYSAKNDIKLLYFQQASQVVRAIRDMLACSDSIEKIKTNKSLAAYHANIMTSLSKIILAAKVAGGLWPPPDAVHSMRYQAGQVLLAVRHFVAVAQVSSPPFIVGFGY